jgi:hypothetical protein
MIWSITGANQGTDNKNEVQVKMWVPNLEK